MEKSVCGPAGCHRRLPRPNEEKVSDLFYPLPADQRNLGMSMRVERSDIDQVRARLASRKVSPMTRAPRKNTATEGRSPGVLSPCSAPLNK